MIESLKGQVQDATLVQLVHFPLPLSVVWAILIWSVNILRGRRHRLKRGFSRYTLHESEKVQISCEYQQPNSCQTEMIDMYYNHLYM